MAQFKVTAPPENFAGATSPGQPLTRKASTSIERAAALDGQLYAVVAPIFNVAGGTTSYIRLFNGQGLAGTTTKSSTFTIKVLGSPSGTLYGTAQVQVPALASPQYSIGEILTRANAAALSGGDTAYSLFIQDSDLVGYQHVIFNPANGFFENLTTCSQGYLNNANDSTQVLTNVHTTRLATYPVQISISNFQNTAVTYKVTVIDALTGTTIGNVNIATAANATYLINESFFEQQLNWTPTASQLHVNLVVQVPTTGASLPTVNAVVGQYITNQSLNAYLNMSIGCLVGNYAPSPGPFPVVGANGIYKGTGSTGSLLVVIGADGKIWVLLPDLSAIGGLAWGTGTSTSTSFTTSSAQSFWPLSVTSGPTAGMHVGGGEFISGTIATSYNVGQDLSGSLKFVASGSVNNVNVTFTRLDYDPTSLTAATLGQIAGTYQGIIASSAASSNLPSWAPAPTLTVSPTGAISGSMTCVSTPFGTPATASCNIAGTITPRTDIRAYDVTISFPTSGGGSVSQAFTAQTHTGIAYYDTVLNKLTIMAMTSANAIVVFSSTTRN